MREIRWTLQAALDLEATLDYLQTEWNETVALKFMDRLEDSLKLIQVRPQLFPKSEGILTVHKCLVTKHNTLYYRVQKSEIIILSLWNNQQNPEKIDWQ